MSKRFQDTFCRFRITDQEPTPSAPAVQFPVSAFHSSALRTGLRTEKHAAVRRWAEALGFVNAVRLVGDGTAALRSKMRIAGLPALQVAPVQDLSYNAGVYLAADYPPEFESFKERLLELAQIRSVAELLRRVVTRLGRTAVSRAGAHLARGQGRPLFLLLHASEVS
jgi:hypothetical protein